MNLGFLQNIWILPVTENATNNIAFQDLNINALSFNVEKYLDDLIITVLIIVGSISIKLFKHSGIDLTTPKVIDNYRTFADSTGNHKVNQGK